MSQTCQSIEEVMTICTKLRVQWQIRNIHEQYLFSGFIWTKTIDQTIYPWFQSNTDKKAHNKTMIFKPSTLVLECTESSMKNGEAVEQLIVRGYVLAILFRYTHTVQSRSV